MVLLIILPCVGGCNGDTDAAHGYIWVMLISAGCGV